MAICAAILSLSLLEGNINQQLSWLQNEKQDFCLRLFFDYIIWMAFLLFRKS